MNMIERVSRAIAVAKGENPDDPAWVIYPGPETFGICWTKYIDQARAAIEALREPTEAMVETACKTHKAGEKNSYGRECTRIHNARFRYQAMIDEALKPAALGEGE